MKLLRRTVITAKKNGSQNTVSPVHVTVITLIGLDTFIHSVYNNEDVCRCL